MSGEEQKLTCAASAPGAPSPAKDPDAGCDGLGTRGDAITLDQWEAEGLRRFGEDRERWAFKCPMCRNAMSIARARAEFPELKGTGWRPESECIGRYIDTAAARMFFDGRRSDKRCDWCAYGLFAGPVFVRVSGAGIVPAFEFGDARSPAVQPEATPPVAPAPTDPRQRKSDVSGS